MPLLRHHPAAHSVDATDTTEITCADCGRALGTWGELQEDFASQGGPKGRFSPLERQDQTHRVASRANDPRARYSLLTLALMENAHRLALRHYLGVLNFAAPLVFAELHDRVVLQFIRLEPVPETASGRSLSRCSSLRNP